MNPLRILPIVYITVAFIFSSCSKKNEFNPYLKGDIIGYAYCFDEYGNQLEDFSDINVYTEPGRKYHATTDKNGKYVIKDVINGTYNLSFEKEGFGTMKLFSVKHLGGYPTVMDYYYGNKAPFIYQNITTQITNFEFVNDSINASVSISSLYKPSLLQMRLFFSTEKNFAIESAQASKNLTLYEYYNVYVSYESVTEGLSFEPGNIVYYRACLFTKRVFALLLFDNVYITGTDTYFDFEKNQTIYPNLSNESEEFSFIMP